MSFIENMSIKHKQMLIILLIAGTSLVLACVAFGTYDVLTFRAAMVRKLATLGEMLGDNAAAALDFNDAKAAEETLAQLKAEPNVIGASIYDKNGKIFVEYDRAGDGRISVTPDMQKQGHTFGKDRLILFSPIDYKNDVIGTIYIASDLQELKSRLARYATITGGVFLVSMLTAFLLAGRLQRLISEPILQLVKIAHAVARDKDYSIRVARHSRDEIGVLIDGFNEMLSQIQERDAVLQRTHLGLEKRVAERTQELASSLALVHATLESTADGIVVTDRVGEAINWNEKFLQMWGFSRELMADGQGKARVQSAVAQLREPGDYLAKVEELYGRPEAESFDVFELKDGRIFERTSKPQRIGSKSVGRVWSFRDITERKRAEKELSWKTAVLEAQIESSYDGIIVMGTSGKKIFQNQRVADLWKIPREIAEDPDAERQIKFAAGLTRNPAQMLEQIRQINAHPDEIHHSEVELLDGTCLDRYSYPIIGKDGSRYGRIWSFRDVTDRKRAESELLGKSALLEAQANSSLEGMLVVDNQGKRVFLNQRLIDMWQVPPHILEDEDDRVMLNYAVNLTEQPEKFFEKVMHLYAQPQATSQDEIKFKNGSVLERYTAPVLGKDGTHYGRIWAFRDVTARKQAEAELARERDLLGALMDNSPDYIYFKDAESRFLRCSQSLAQRYQVDAAALIGKSDFDIFTEEHARPAFDDEQQIIRSGKPIIGKIEKEIWQQGEVTWVLTSKMPLRDKEGRIIGTFGISKDVTAMKEAEAKLEQAHRQLLETSRMAGMAEVATSVLHNVGNVLNSVNVSCSVVSDRVRKSKVANLSKAMTLLREHEQNLPAFFTDDPKGRQLPGYLNSLAEHLGLEQKEVLEELTHLSRNVDHIKEIVAMQQSYSKVSGVRELLAPADLVEDALRMNGAAMERHQIKIVREYLAVPPVLVEKHKVLQILVNLIRNAKYACDETGRTDKQVTLRIESAAGTAKISVIDNGVGILAENLTRIFEHGFTTRKEGHGYGLHSGALAAKDLGGALIVASDGPGRGASFSLALPCQPLESEL